MPKAKFQPTYKIHDAIVFNNQTYIKGSPIGFATFKTIEGFDNPAGFINAIVETPGIITVFIERKNGSTEPCPLRKGNVNA